MEPQPFASEMQREMIRQIERVHPKFLVYMDRWSWNITADSDKTILEWGDRYAAECYDLAGLMDLTSLTQPVWLWDDAIAGYQPKSDRLIHIYRQKSAAPCAVSK